MLDLWLRILDIMDRLMNSGQGDNLEEAVPESLKNILLVMADGGFIQPPSNDSSPTELWDETCKRVDRFLPNLIAEIFPQVNAAAQEPPLSKQDTSTKPAAAQRSSEEPRISAERPKAEVEGAVA